MKNRSVEKLIIIGLKKIKVSRTLLKKVKISIGEGRDDKEEFERNILEDYSANPNGKSIYARGHCKNKREFKLAIIVPVYNVEKYIRRCITTLLEQITDCTYQIIIVNDGTRDQSIEKIKDLITNPRILYIEQTNKGLSGARNTGLDYMNAEYIAFVDSDDYVSKYFVDTMVKSAEKYNADIVQGSFKKIFQKECFSKGKRFSEEICNNKYAIPGFAWGKIFKAELFDNIQFPEGYWYEDTVVPHLIYPLANKIVTIAEYVYMYRTNIKGISRTSLKNKKCIDSTWIVSEMLDARRALNMENDLLYLRFFLFQLYINFMREFNVEEEIKEQVFLYNRKMLKDYFQKYTDSDELRLWEYKLYQSLYNKDYKGYKRVCMFCS